jgi:hypothetical protein
MTGIELIAQERARQISKEGWDQKHDEQHTEHELIEAAAYYCAYNAAEETMCSLEGYRDFVEGFFPAQWDEDWMKRQGFPVPTDNDLVKAGALIAAELDRRTLERAANGTGTVTIIPPAAAHQNPVTLCPACKSMAIIPEYRFREGVPQESHSCLDCGHVWLSGSQYGSSVEQPEEEA